MLRTMLLAFSFAVATIGSAVSAVPQQTIKAWQDGAPEALEITVLSLSETRQAQPVPGQPGCTRTVREFTVTAKIDAVRRTASSLKPGQTITFNHSTISVYPCVLPGVNFGQVLSVGDHVEAYLSPAGTADGLLLANDLKKITEGSVK
jgi:hypothetical protein